MGVLRDLGQKLKGKGQQIKGRRDISYGHTIRGSVTQLKGELNELAADTKLRNRKRRTRSY